MKRVGSIIRLRPEYEERYIILHRNTFPGVLERIRKSNIRNYTIFLREGILFSYYEYTGKDFDADMKAISDPVTKDWWKLTDPMQEPLPARRAGEWWAEMENMFCLQKKASSDTCIQRIGLKAEIIPGREMELKNFLKNFPCELEDSMNKENFQNLNIFMKEGKLYFYYEYTGNDLMHSVLNLSGSEEFAEFQLGLNRLLKPKGRNPWLKMEEVFHTS